MYQNERLYFVKIPKNDTLCTSAQPDGNIIASYSYVQSPQILLSPSNPTNYCFSYISGSPDVVNIYRRNSDGSCGTILAGSFPWVDTLALFHLCGEAILQASVSEFKASGWVFNYADANISSLSSNKEHFLRIPNIYRSLHTNLFVTERKQTGSYNNTQYNTNAAYDGTFNFFSYYNYQAGNARNLQKPWRWTTEVTKYSPFNFEIENKNPLNIYSAALYGYKQSLVTAVAQNARYCEIGFDSFENDSNISPGSPRGHLVYNGGTIYEGIGHTGNKSLAVGPNGMQINVKMTDSIFSNVGGDGRLYLVKNKNYLFSCWVRKANIQFDDNLGRDYNISINAGTVVTPNIKEPLVEGWQRIEFVFSSHTAPPSGTNIIIQLPTYSGTLYFDDIRIMPADAIMKTYVYNPKNYRLEAELDENNYATFYNYDEENVLVQIKKETERGIMTLQTTRQNLKKQ